VLVWLMRALVVSASMIPLHFSAVYRCVPEMSGTLKISVKKKGSFFYYALFLLCVFVDIVHCSPLSHRLNPLPVYDQRILFFQPSTLACHHVFLGAASISAIRRS
jgi:hypothetical protein